MTVCGNNIALPSDAKYNQLSGIITSSSMAPVQRSLESCDTTISNIPKGEVTMRIELLYVLDSSENYAVLQDGASTKLKRREPKFISITNQQLTFMYKTEERKLNAFFFKFQGKTMLVDSAKGLFFNLIQHYYNLIYYV